MIEISKLWLAIPAGIIGVTCIGLLIGFAIQVLLFFGEDKQWKYTLSIGVAISWIGFLLLTGLVKFV